MAVVVDTVFVFLRSFNYSLPWWHGVSTSLSLKVQMSLTFVFISSVSPQDETNDEILQLLPTADMSKINLLQVRLTSSQKRSGPCPVPEFTEHEEFFHDFILHSDSYIFHQHLKDSLCSEILSLNETEFCVPDEHDPGSLCHSLLRCNYRDRASAILALYVAFWGTKNMCYCFVFWKTFSFYCCFCW